MVEANMTFIGENLVYKFSISTNTWSIVVNYSSFCR